MALGSSAMTRAVHFFTVMEGRQNEVGLGKYYIEGQEWAFPSLLFRVPDVRIAIAMLITRNYLPNSNSRINHFISPITSHDDLLPGLRALSAEGMSIQMQCAVYQTKLF